MSQLLDDLPYMPLRPEETMVVVVDPLACFVSHLSEVDKKALSHKMDVLYGVADKISIPVAVSVLGEGTDTLWPVNLSNSRKLDLYPRTVANPWDDKGLRAAIDKHGPSYILLADCCPDMEKNSRSLDYMIRAGVAPVSWRQVIFEWARHQPLILSETFLADLTRNTALPEELRTALCRAE
ncbi:MAG: hypothetical protein COB36_14565 [Alphaproteobacteria bacterium]|nr:MAG: hypothetical protein COB36_14565 [Alphaproteobacteria bacterium]